MNRPPVTNADVWAARHVKAQRIHRWYWVGVGVLAVAIAVAMLVSGNTKHVLGAPFTVVLLGGVLFLPVIFATTVWKRTKQATDILGSHLTGGAGAAPVARGPYQPPMPPPGPYQQVIEEGVHDDDGYGHLTF